MFRKKNIIKKNQRVFFLGGGVCCFGFGFEIEETGSRYCSNC